MYSRTASVCLAVVLVVSLLAAGTVPAEANGGDDWWDSIFQDQDERDGNDEVDEDDDERDEDDEDEEDEDDDERDEDDERSEESDGDDEEDDGDDDREEEQEAFEETKEELEETGDELSQKVEQEAEEISDSNCNEDDDDRGHGNDCDGVDEDNPGNDPGGDEEARDENELQATPTPEPSPTPTPTATPTATPNPTPTASPTPEQSDDPSTVEDDETPPPAESSGGDSANVRSSEHEVGGFNDVRSVSANRTTIAAGEWVEIVAIVQNVDDDPRELTVNFTIFDEIVDAETVSVQPGETGRVRLVQKFDAPGTFHPSVGGVETTVHVEERPKTLVERTTNAPGQAGFGAGVTVVVLTVGTLVARRWG